MRWFKHLTRAHLDESVTPLLASMGPEGYGLYWLLCEVVAESMDASDRCSLKHPEAEWARQLYVARPRVVRVMLALQKAGLVTFQETVEERTKYITVTIRTLLKYRDEYSSKTKKNRDNVPIVSGQTPDSVPTLTRARSETETEAEADTEAETEREQNVRDSAPELATSGKPAPVPSDERDNPRSTRVTAKTVKEFPLDVWADRLYSRHIKRRDRELVNFELRKLYERCVERGVDPERKFSEVEACLIAWNETPEWREKHGRFAPKLAEWLNDEGFEQWPATDEQPRNGKPVNPAIEKLRRVARGEATL